MNPCEDCHRPVGVHCCHNCKKDANKCNEYHGCGSCDAWERGIFTNADRIRRTDDVELMNRIYELHVLLSEFGHYELAEQFCDCKAECHDGEDCSEDRVKACILRWLQRPVEGC